MALDSSSLQRPRSSGRFSATRCGWAYAFRRSGAAARTSAPRKTLPASGNLGRRERTQGAEAALGLARDLDQKRNPSDGRGLSHLLGDGLARPRRARCIPAGAARNLTPDPRSRKSHALNQRAPTAMLQLRTSRADGQAPAHRCDRATPASAPVSSRNDNGSDSGGLIGRGGHAPGREPGNAFGPQQPLRRIEKGRTCVRQYEPVLGSARVLARPLSGISDHEHHLGL